MAKEKNLSRSRALLTEIRNAFSTFDAEASIFCAKGTVVAGRKARVQIGEIKRLMKEWRKASIEA